MRADLTVECGSAEHTSLVRLSWGLMVVWPIGMPCVYLALLCRARHDIRRRRHSFAAASTHFLWADYEPHFFYWECVDMARKLSLTSYILFLDTDEGYTKVGRLVVGALVSVLALAMSLLMRPFRREVEHCTT